MDKKPRILVIAPLPPPVHGSAMVSQQIKDSEVINGAFTCDYVNLSTCRKMTEAGYFSFAKLWRVSSSFFKAFCYLLVHHYDMCYLAITCRGGSFIKDTPFILLCKLFRRKIVIHQHNKGMANYVDRQPYKWLYPIVYKNVKVILLSWHLYPDIERIVPKENVLICPNGIKISDCDASAGSKTKPETLNVKLETDRAPRLLFLSNLIESKGVFVLLDALKILADKGVLFRCVFVGAETAKISAERFAEEVDKRGLNRVVVYLGRKIGEEKERVLADADIFVFPTFYEYECFPLVLLEAMAHKLPCVTTKEGGICDIVENGVNGYVCPQKDPIAVAFALEDLIADEALRSAMGEIGFRLLMERFTDSVFEERITSIIKEIIRA